MEQKVDQSTTIRGSLISPLLLTKPGGLLGVVEKSLYGARASRRNNWPGIFRAPKLTNYQNPNGAKITFDCILIFK